MTQPTYPNAKTLGYENNSIPVLVGNGAIELRESPTEWFEMDESSAVMNLSEWA